MIIFENKGLIDIHAITIMGVSVKQENSIGYFGTGLKYAIAVLLREGLKITIWRGKEEISFETRAVEIRGKMFDLIYMGGEKLGFTTELGKNWKIWQAFREIYCNCKDESGVTKSLNDFNGAKDDITKVVVEGEQFEEIYNTRSLYFIETAPDIILRCAEVQKKNSKSLFYKSINVYSEQEAFLYTWNITTTIGLTEDRTAKYKYELDNRLSTAIAHSTDEEFIESCILAPEGSFEACLKYGLSEKPSNDFISVCAGLYKNFNKDVNRSAINYAKKHADWKSPEEAFKPDELQQSMFARATELLNRAGFGVNKYNIDFIKSLGAGVGGRARNKRITITEAAFGAGTKELAITLLEELWHLEYGYQDETRNFQNFLFTQIGTLIERINKEPF